MHLSIAGGGFTDLVIGTIFGANLTLFEGFGIQSRLTDFDPKARLVNLPLSRQELADLIWQGEAFDELRRNYR